MEPSSQERIWRQPGPRVTAVAPASLPPDRGASSTNFSSATASASGSSRCESSRPPCRFFLLGKCKFGDACTFSHQPQGRVPVCTFFERNGSCRYGDCCKFLHGRPAPELGSTAAPSASFVGLAGGAGSAAGARGSGDASSSGVPGVAVAGVAAAAAAGDTGAKTGELERVQGNAGDNCGICLENIPASGKRFGLLNCDHVYCLECLRTWRKSKGPQKDISRTCPECRKVSFFLVPSKEHLKGKAKAKAIQAYKKGLSKLPCKYHRGEGGTVCPFGVRCFYAHLDENGVDIKDRPQPVAPAPSRRTCPYLRDGGRYEGRGGIGVDGRRDASRGHYHPHFREFTFFGDEDVRRFHDPRGQASAIIRLQQLMLLTEEL